MKKQIDWKSVKTFLAIIITVAIIGFTVSLLSSCTVSHLSDARPATLVSSEKVKHSTNYIVCIQDRAGNRYSCKWNSHCYRCTASAIPANWNVVTTRNGKIFLQPVN